MKKLSVRHKAKILRLLIEGGTKLVSKYFDVGPKVVRRFRREHFSTYVPPGRHVVYKERFFVYADGRVWDIKMFRYLIPDVDRYGYSSVFLNYERIKLHRLLLTVFKRGPIGDEQGRHMDGDPSHNHISNLKWGSPLRNQRDRDAHGTNNVGERNGAARLNWVRVAIIRRAYDRHGASVIKFFAKRYGVTPVCIGHVAKRKTWIK